MILLNQISYLSTITARTIICFGLLSMSLNLYGHGLNGGSEYVHVVPNYSDGKCKLFFWLGIGEDRHRKMYTSEPQEINSSTYCIIRIPNKEFESIFEYCALSGFQADNTEKILTEFSGGEAHDRDHYWFEWRDAKTFFPRYICKLKHN